MGTGSAAPHLEIPANGIGSRYELTGSDVLGRGAGATIRIDDPSVADAHAHLVRSGDSVLLTDLGSAHGTTVNAVRIGTPTALREGDEIRFGTVSAVFRWPRAGLAPEEPIGRSPSPDGLPSGSPTGPSPTPAVSAGTVRGTVLRCSLPSPQDPRLMIELRTDAGEAVVARRLFAVPIGAPHVAEGHHVAVTGRRKRRGSMTVHRIVYESTSETWSRTPRLLVGGALVAAAVLVWLFTGPATSPVPGPVTDTRPITVPAVVGLPLERARADLRDAGFRDVVEIRERSDLPIFAVVRTVPPAGTVLPPGTRIDLYFSFPR